MSELLSGRLGFVFVVSILDAVLLSFIGLWWYRRAVRGFMGASKASVPRQGADVVRGASGAVSFALERPAATRPPRSVVRARAQPSRRLSVAYGLGAAFHAGIITAFVIAADPPPSPVSIFARWWIYTWPILPTLFAVHVLDRGARWRALLGHVAWGVAALVAFTVSRQLASSTLDFAAVTNVFWMLVGFAFTAAPPFALVWLSGWRRVRGVTPLALAATLLFGFGLMASMDVVILALDWAASRSMVLWLSGATSVRFARHFPFLLMSLPIGWLAWGLLRGLGRAFSRKRFSDVQLVVDCWWVVATLEQVAVDLARDYAAWSLAIGALAFASYRGAVALVLAGARWSSSGHGRRLLLLRVFGHQRRTEALFDHVAQRWRWFGPVQLIGGVDLATRTVDPGDVLAFIGGRLSEHCVVSHEQIEPLIARLDVERDPDGRFRVNEVYCQAPTWQATLQRLLGVSDLVLMDLRTFSRRNAGCEFELEQLLRCLPTDRVVLVCDHTTDIEYLELVLSNAWAAASRDGLGQGRPTFAVCPVDRQSPRELSELFETLRDVSRLSPAASAPAAVAAGA